MDALILAAARWWIAKRPFQHLRARREAKRAQAASSTAGDPGASPSPESGVLAMGEVTSQGDGMSELMKSMIRSVMKVLGGAAVAWALGHGLIGIDQSAALAAALEAIAGGVAVIVGFWWSHRTHAVA